MSSKGMNASATTFYRLKGVTDKTNELEVSVSGLEDQWPDANPESKDGDEFILVMNESGERTWEQNSSRYKDTLEPRGFTHGSRGTSYISADDVEMEFTISGSYAYWSGGERYSAAVGNTVAWTDVEGMHYFYFDSEGTLQHSTTFTESLIAADCYVGCIYWDSTNSGVIYLGDERHGCSMDWATHVYIHNTQGAQYVTGLALSDIVADQNGDDPEDAQLGYEQGLIYDEDLAHVISTASAPANIPMFYKIGVSGYWRRQEANDYPIIVVSGGLAAWNEWTGSTWQQTEVGDNDFVLTHIFATNDPNQPIVGIQGQSDYAILAYARAGAIQEINDIVVAGTPFEEFVPIGTVIFKTSNGSDNAVKSAIVSTDEGNDYEDFRTIGGGGINDHGNLSGLGDDDHAQYVLADGTRAMQYVVAGSGIFPSGIVVGDNSTMDGVTFTDNLDAGNELVYFAEANNGSSITGTAINWGAGGHKQRTLLENNPTFTFTDPPGPCNLLLVVVQDGTGGRTVTWPASVKWVGGSAPTLSTAANAVDIVSFYFDGTNYYGAAGLGFA